VIGARLSPKQAPTPAPARNRALQGSYDGPDRLNHNTHREANIESPRDS